MTPLLMALGGGAIGTGIGLLCGCPDRGFKYGIVGLAAGALVGKLSSPTTVGDQRHMTGFQCPEGFELVASDHQIACAYRQKASCLAGFPTETGTFHCTDWDFVCPPGMSTHRDGPSNWCFPTS